MITDPYSQSKFAIDGRDITITGLQNSIVFSLQVAGATIVSETYNYDNEGKVVIRGIADIVSKALYGTLDTGLQDKACATVDFLVDGDVQFTKTLYSSRFMNPHDPNGEKVVLAAATRGVCYSDKTFYITAIGPLDVRLLDDSLEEISKTRIGVSGVSPTSVITNSITCAGMFPKNYLSGRYLDIGGEMTVEILPGPCDDAVPVRFLNRYDVMESLVAAYMTEKPSVQADTGQMYGKNTRFTVKSATEYTLHSGRLRHQEQFDTWQDLLTSRKAQVYLHEAWHDIVVSKSNFTRNRRRFYGSQVEISFQTANPYLTL